MNLYSVKEIYPTLQGEGAHTGRPAIFCRFAGCNLWTGREEDRAKAICQFCDTDFWGIDGINGGKYTRSELSEIIRLLAIDHKSEYVVFTGGEPALQLEVELIDGLHSHNLICAIETNGTLPVPENLDWVCLSPKANTEIVLTECDELKIVYPQEDLDPFDYKNIKAEYRFLQPMDGPFRDQATKSCLEFIEKNPQWRISIQTHKIMQIP